MDDARQVNDVTRVLEPVDHLAHVMLWAVASFAVVFPLTGLLAAVVLRNGSTHGELAGLWLVFLLGASGATHVFVERRRGVATRAMLLRTAAVLLVLFVAAQTAWAHLFGAIDRGKQRSAMAEMREIATAVEEYRSVHGALPRAGGVEELSSVLGRRLPLHDPWGARYELAQSSRGYRIVSFGADRKRDVEEEPHPVVVQTTKLDSDLVLENGLFVRYPEGIRPE